MEILKYIFDFDISRMFDCDNDGFLTVHDLRRIMTSLGDDKLSKKDVEMMVEEADKDKDGLVNCQGKERKKVYENYQNNSRILLSTLPRW